MILEMKLGSSLAWSLTSLQTATQCSFWPFLSSLGTYFAAMHLIFKLSNKMHWMVLYNSPMISQASWIVHVRSARIASHTFWCFRVWCLSTSIQNSHRHLSLKCLCHKKVMPWLIALSPYASLSIRWVSAAVFWPWSEIWCRFFAP